MTERQDEADSPPDSVPGDFGLECGSSLTRRAWLRGVAASGGLWSAVASTQAAARRGKPDELPDRVLLESKPEKFWARLRAEQFLLPHDRVFLNPGSLGVVSRPVLAEVIRSLTSGAEYRSDSVVRWGYENLVPEREEMARFLGCDAADLAFTHNCTEAMNFIAGGLELRPGDEVLTTDQEHPGGSACWKLQAARRGISVRAVSLPLAPEDPGELTERLAGSIGPKTRVLSFSGITSPTGLVMPVREICAAARERGVVSVVDGAHMDGQVPVRLVDLGCDYFAGSPHKWLFAPPGCGLLYGREGRLDTLWPSVAGSGWDNAKDLRAARFMMVGTNGRSTIDGMLAGVRFLGALGESVAYARMHQLARMALEESRRRDYLDVVTRDDDRLFQAMVSIRFKTAELEPLWARLRSRNIAVLGGQRLRLSFHVHTRPSDIHAFFEACDDVLGKPRGR